MKDGDEYIKSLSNLLNGQLRGSINKKARDENLELINLTLQSIFENAFNEGLKEGVNTARSEILKEEIVDRVKLDLEKDS